MHSHLEEKLCLFVKLVEQITKGKYIKFFSPLCYVEQTVPSLALMKEERPHFESEKKVKNYLKRILAEHHFAFNPKSQ